MPSKLPLALPQLQLCFDAVEEPEPMNEPAATATLLHLAAPAPSASKDITLLESPPASNAAALLESLPASNATALPDTDAPLQRGSAAALLKRHAAKQAQGLAAPTKREKLPKSADDTPVSLLAYAMREVPPDKLLQQAQEAEDFAAACRRLCQACSHWAKDIQKKAADEKRNLTAGERKGVAFWTCEANQAGQALAIFDACNGDKRAAVDALQDSDLERFAVALRTGCYVTLGL